MEVRPFYFKTKTMTYISATASQYFHSDQWGKSMDTKEVGGHTVVSKKDGYVTLEVYGKPIAKRQIGVKSYFVCTQMYTSNLVMSRILYLKNIVHLRPSRVHSMNRSGTHYVIRFISKGANFSTVTVWDGKWKLITV